MLSRFLKIITTMYLFAMLVLFPLATNGNYFDILEVKWISCLAPTVLYILLSAIAMILDRIYYKKSGTVLPCKCSRHNIVFLAFGIIYAIVVIIGMMQCDHRLISFWGLSGRYLGVMIIVPLIIAMYIVSSQFYHTKLMWYGTGISSGIIFLLQILHEFHIDPLGLWRGVPQDQIKYFASTIGNLNFNATYDCMILSIAMAITFAGNKNRKKDSFQNNNSKNKHSKKAGNKRFKQYPTICCTDKCSALPINISDIFTAMLISLGFAGCIGIRSDGVFAGIAAEVIVLVIYTIRHTEFMNRLLLILAAMTAGSLIMSVLYRSGIDHFELNPFSEMLLKPEIIESEVTMLATLFLINKFADIKVSKTALISTTIAAIIICIVIVLNGEDAIIDISNINDHTAHNRVYVWRNTVAMMCGSYTLPQWIFGCGINEFRFAFYDWCGTEMAADGYNTFIDAHSEYLQALAATGILGLLSYFGMILITLVSGMRKTHKDPARLLSVCFVISFLVQGLVYSPQITTTPLLFITLGLLSSDKLRKQ